MRLLVGAWRLRCYPTRRSKAAAEAILRADGTALVEAGTQDLGKARNGNDAGCGGCDRIVAQRDVTFRLGDTEFPGNSRVGRFANRCQHRLCRELAAAQALREKIMQMAVTDPQSPLFNGATAGDVTI